MSKKKEIEYDYKKPMTVKMLIEWLQQQYKDAVICVVDGEDCDECGNFSDIHALRWGDLEEVAMQTIFTESAFDIEDEHQLLVWPSILDKK